MKFQKMITVCLVLNFILFAKDFLRELPSEKLISQLTPTNFPNMDAVIILKEQSYKISPTAVHYRGYILEGPSIITTSINLIKTFNEAGVNRYANFEYEYSEPFGDEIPCGFLIQARVLKPSGKIIKISSKNAKTIVSIKAYDGEPISRKVIFKLPNVSPGDIIQIEYALTEPLSRSSSGIFYYHDRDFVLFSNLFITLPFKATANYYSFPQNKVGNPQIMDISKTYGDGQTYFWSLKNLNPIPNEAFSVPFTSQSYMTAFVVDKWEINDPTIGNWNDIAEDYNKRYIRGKKLPNRYIASLNLSDDPDQFNKTFGIIDTLYHILRDKIEIRKYNSLYPVEELSDVFINGYGDATDIALIMYKILEKWKFNPQLVWIKDKREGIFQQSVPSTRWFDRVGVQVSINNEKRLYDFDPSIPKWFQTPWFDKNIELVIIDETIARIEKAKSPSNYLNNLTKEEYYIHFENDIISQKCSISMNGGFADNFRYSNYLSDSLEIHRSLEQLAQHAFSTIDTIHWNDFADFQDVKIEYQGTPSTKVQNLQQFLVFKCSNSILSDLRNTLYSYNRHTGVDLEFPNRIESIWHIYAPEKCHLDSLTLESERLSGPNASFANFTVQHSDSLIYFKTTVNFPESFIPIKNYPSLIQFLDNIIFIANQNIVIKPD